MATHTRAEKPFSRTGMRFAPQSPGCAVKIPAQCVPQNLQAPSAVRFQSDSTYQSRPINIFPQ